MAQHSSSPICRKCFTEIFGNHMLQIKNKRNEKCSICGQEPAEIGYVSTKTLPQKKEAV